LPLPVQAIGWILITPVSTPTHQSPASAMSRSQLRQSGTGIESPHIVCRSWLIITGINIRSTSELCHPGFLFSSQTTKTSSAAGLLDVRTDRMVRLRPAGIDWLRGTLGCCREGGICDDPMEIHQACRQMPTSRPLELLAVYNIHWSGRFRCDHMCNISSDNERKQPRPINSFPSQHVHPADCLMARVRL
jgi:hypothetical protein